MILGNKQPCWFYELSLNQSKLQESVRLSLQQKNPLVFFAFSIETKIHFLEELSVLYT